MSFVRLVLMTTMLFNGSFALSAGVEAWVSKSSFDGTDYNYEVIAYDAEEPVTDYTGIFCDLTGPQGEKVLKAVEIKVFLSADFNAPGKQVTKSGSVNVPNAIRACREINRHFLKADDGVTAPVEIRLPKISVPSK